VHSKNSVAFSSKHTKGMSLLVMILHTIIVMADLRIRQWCSKGYTHNNMEGTRAPDRICATELCKDWLLRIKFRKRYAHLRDTSHLRIRKREGCVQMYNPLL